MLCMLRRWLFLYLQRALCGISLSRQCRACVPQRNMIKSGMILVFSISLSARLMSVLGGLSDDEGNSYHLAGCDAGRVLLESSGVWPSCGRVLHGGIPWDAGRRDFEMSQNPLRRPKASDMPCDLAQVAHAEDRRNFSGGSEDSHPAGKSNKRYVSTGLFKDF